MATADEAIAFINDLPEEERAKFATSFQNDGGPVVTAARSKAFAAGKKKGAEGVADAAAKLAEVQTRVEELEAELTDTKAKTPDAAAIEKRTRDQLAPKLEAEKARADAAEARIRKQAVDLAMGEFATALATPQPDGTFLRPNAVKLAKYEHGDRIRVNPDGSVNVLQPGSEIAYEAPDTATALRLLAADVRRAMDPDSIGTNADTGGGIQNGGFGGGGSANPAKVEQQRVEQARAAVSGAF